ncbi:hypothetical protein WA026_003911 [Henosepilachna vigintioctopunctata]|uniref:Uncharacterized protein n=1 Tax=Henosepilachna vigintioctopunctata TaxID=420089 RepID=A0AAW1UH89_9CUCU
MVAVGLTGFAICAIPRPPFRIMQLFITSGSPEMHASHKGAEAIPSSLYVWFYLRDYGSTNEKAGKLVKRLRLMDTHGTLNFNVTRENCQSIPDLQI